MTTREALVIDAFADEPFAGSPVGVVPDATGLDADQMGAIAAELNASETAFVQHAEGADRRLRFFTPATEIDRCAHGTLAVHAHLYERALIEAGSSTVETAAGTVEVTVDGDGTVWLAGADASVVSVDVDHESVAAALGLDVASLRDVGADLPLSRASTGEPWLVVPVNYFEHLSAASPDMAAVEELCEATETAGLYAFTFDTLDGDATLHARAFASGAGVSEDAVTATAAGACAAVVRHHGAVEPDMGEVVVEQGHVLDRPGRVRVRIDGKTVDVGGRAATAMTGDIAVPDREEADIVQA